ncbi:MipA/OmpV family protein [Bowmanella denitrificans]|uniref:MipA/OmpV family protein n=1 Tax=Bowmanella denitrificans TaxID=366582 RepID=A0ABN0XW74_9ALTE|nr:MipA/OmpV family protein [Bowmanella denitrificans]
MTLRVGLWIVLVGLMAGPSAIACESQCIEKGQWQLGVAIGAGVRSNPLVDGDNIPLVVLPDIAWYGEAFYLDNDEVGYQVIDNGTFALEGFVNLNKEAANFAFWHPANLFSNMALGSGFIGPSMEVKRTVSKDDVATRRWSVNGGVRLHLRHESGEFQASMVTDVGKVHHGQQAELSYSLSWQTGHWTWVATPSLVWKSTKLVDYYYGLDDRDEVDTSLYYEARSGWYPSLSIQVIRPIAEHWRLIGSLTWTELHKGMTASPLLDESKIRGIFVGAAYHF